MMMIVFPVFGAITGALIARKRGGSKLDMAQYAGVMFIIGAVLGIFATILLARTL